MLCDYDKFPPSNFVECFVYQPGYWQQDVYTIPFGALLVTAVGRLDPPRSPRWPFQSETATEIRNPSRHPGTFAATLAGAVMVPVFGSIYSARPDFSALTHVRGLVHSHLWTELFTSGAKAFFGRKRPFYDTVLRRGEARRDDRFSFFSGHSSHSFALASYVSQLAIYELKSSALSYIYSGALYSIATWVGASRAIDRQHNWSDVLTGAGVGFTVGRLVFRQVAETAGDAVHIQVEPGKIKLSLKVQTD